ncbi:hybrid sensor histidine kinase/response regulator [Devosia naphthalenivorans]|uniref:hybrid sensor histidine kinase/response regulator n=1 Tax=Devosia naphthalenivorans TaxID=2082392 RepID=UPI000D380290|nr:PAS domain-containing sensor histidine kinase [Devosia naphthalenivorans]
MESSDNFAASGTAEGRYRLLVESISDYAIYMLDPDGRVVNWNLGAERFKGYTADEIIGQNFAKFYSEEERASGAPARNLAKAATEGRFEEEGWRYRKDGSRFWASIVIDRIVDPEGKLVGFAKITRDLTERRAREEALRRSEEQFRLLVKGVTDYALYMLDPEGNVISWNAGAERIKGYAEAEIIGQNFSVFYMEGERENGEPQRNLEIARSRGSVEREGMRVRKDGTTFFAHVVIDALYDDAGELVGFAKLTRDITQQRKTQQELEGAREALFQAQKMEAIGQLTGGIAHDFNNLLMAILGSLEIAQRRMNADPRISPFLDNAVKGAQRGAALTQRMLAFARRQELAMGPVDVLDTVRGMNDILERALGPSIFVTTNFPLSLPPVRTDKAQLESALLNLAVNARDAMPAGGPIAIAAQRRAAPQGGIQRSGDYVVLSVADIGEGMDEETLARATEPFFTTKGVGKGTGLGLSMVHGLAEQSGGTFLLKSEKGHGTTAELWLPLAPGTSEAAGNSTSAAVSGTTVPKRVLVVDDDFLVLLNTVTMLEDLGHQVIEASSGEEALAVLEREPVDLLVTDYAMPRMSGGELAMMARARNPTLKVLVATGYAEMPDEHRGRFERLGKPFSENDLGSAIERALQS